VSATVYDGKSLVSKLARRIKRDAEQLRRQHHIDVSLGILLITGDQVSMADSGKIAGLAEHAGVSVHVERVAQRNIARKFYPTLEEYAASPFIQGIYIQLPLPTQIMPLAEVMRRLPPEKDVAGLHFVNRGMSTYPPHEVGDRAHPPEVLAVAETLKECGVNMKGGRVVVVGSEETAGLVKILVGYLFDQGCSVRLLRYSNISQATSPGKARRLKSIENDVEIEDTVINPEGEAVVAWANHGGWLTKSRLSPGSVVVDLGYKFARGRVSGDCDFVSVSQTAKVITPVPGGVRNITHVMILQNLIRLIKRQQMESMDKLGRGLQRRFK